MKRAAAKIVPKLLNFEKKNNVHRPEAVDDNPDLLKKIITADESCVYRYDIGTKEQSFKWKRSEEPRLKKARQVR